MKKPAVSGETWQRRLEFALNEMVETFAPLEGKNENYDFAVKHAKKVLRKYRAAHGTQP